jgi:hypothetical protein
MTQPFFCEKLITQPTIQSTLTHLSFILSFVAIELCQINGSQILIFQGTLYFHKFLKGLLSTLANTLVYKDFTVKLPAVASNQTV